MTRELSELEKNEYNELIKSAKQINIFGMEEDLDPHDFVFERIEETRRINEE